MTSREIYLSTIRFDRPPRIAMMLPDPYPYDAVRAHRQGSGNVALEPRGNELRRWRDEWGVTWASLTEFDKGEVVEGAIRDWADLDSWAPPDLGRQEDYEAAARRFAEDDGEHFRMGGIHGFTFNVARKLRKLDSYLCDLVLEREKIDRLHTLVREQLLAAIDCWAAAGADAVCFAEDWGTQDRLMISPDMWREIFRPEFEALAGRIHEHGMYCWMHSCGKITAIIPDLIEVGVDVLQFDQPRLHGIDTLGEFNGKVAFECPVDIQTTLQTRDADAIRAEARELVERLGANGGGFIAGYYPSNESIGLTPDIQDIACRAFLEHGTYAEA